MKKINLKQHIESLFKGTKFTDQNNIIYTNKILEAIEKIDTDLVEILIADHKAKKHFFSKVKDMYVMNQFKLFDFFSMNNYFEESYTSYTNKIGLIRKDDFIKKNNDVVLAFPYKDCVLEGGQTKEDQKGKENFFNEILDSDEIDRLFEPKVLTNIKRYSKDGVEENPTISDKDNLILKGNNLLALHSLKKKYAGEIKLIYIDPPYNPPSSNNTFEYNNNFNHSTWLTFMKNRMEVSKDLLKDDGAMIIAIDENEFAYLGVLIDDVFNDFESHCITIVHNPRGVQGANFSYTHEYAYFIYPKGKKIICDRKIDEKDISYSNLRNWGGESLREDAKNCFYPIIYDKKTKKIVGFGEVCKDDYHPKINEAENNLISIYPVDKEGIERKWRYARQSIEKVKHLLRVKTNQEKNFDIEIGKDFGKYRTVWTGERYDSNEYGTKIVTSLVADNTFSFPKSLWNVYDCISAVVRDDKEAVIIDYHAGSGTTGHAVLELNKEDGGNRKFIMVEQMDYIETITVPRIVKVMERNNIDDSFVYAELKQVSNFDNSNSKLKQEMRYLPIGEIEDEDYKISHEEIVINKSFYGVDDE